MKKISVKKVLICLSIIFFLVGGLLIYAVDPIKINPLRFISTMRIQQIHLYYRLTKSDNGLEKDDIVKAGLKNEGGNDMGVLYIRPVDVTDSFVDETNNSIVHPDEASIIGGQENTNLGYESTMILGGSRNTADGQGVTLMGGDNNTALVDNAVVLGSNNATVGAPNGVIIASEGGTVNGKNSTLLGGGGTITSNAENSFGVVMSNQLEQKGVFAVGRVNVLKPNIVALNFGKGLIVKGTKPNSNSKVQLTVNGALAVGYGKCSDNMVGAVYYVPAETKDEKPAYCLCSCVLSGYNKGGDKIIAPMALSNQPYCDGICNGGGWSEPECGTRGLKDSHLVYENGETDWRVASNYCRDNTMPISYTGSDKKGNVRTCTATLDERCIENPNLSGCTCDPSFLGTGETLEWTCKGIGLYDKVKCGAYRKAAAPDNAVCGENANKYVLNANGFLNPGADGFCHWGDPAHPENRSENAVPVAIKVLSKEDIENGVTGTYVTYDIKDYETVLNELNYYFIKKGGRTFWRCATTNADNETITGAEVVSDQECYAERMPCNYCGTSGFPYCFDVDFGSGCEEGAGSSCIPGSDNNGPYHPLYDSWNSTGHVDSLFAITGLTEFSYTDSWIKGVTFKEVSTEPGHWYASYKFDANTTNSIRTGVVHFKTKDKAFCSSWDVYIVQCENGQILDASHHSCINNQGIIEYDCNFGNGTKANQVFVVGKEGTLTGNNCSRENYDFLGWAESSNATSATYGDKAKFTFSEAKKIVLYAVWKQKEIQKYTVTFDANGGSWITTGSVSVQKDTVLNLKNYTGSKSGHDFVGWNTNSGATTAIGNPTVVSNMTLYAIFKAKTTPSCTEYAWSSYGGQKCTSHSKGNPCSGVDISHLGYSHSANKCTNFHELCCYNEGGSTEQELICACAIDATTPTTNTLHFIPYGYFDNTLQGNGTMQDQIVECGKPFKLNENKFTKDGYLLLDWSLVDREEDNYLMDLNDKEYVSGDSLEDFENSIDNRCGITIDLYAEWTKKGCGTANEKSYNGKPANNLLCSAGITPTNQSENGALYTWKCDGNYCGACTNGFSYSNNCAGIKHTNNVGTVYITPSNNFPYNMSYGSIMVTDGKKTMTIMDRNLGATSAGTGIYEGTCLSSFGLYYRWGTEVGYACHDKTNGSQFNTLNWKNNNKKVSPCPDGWHVPTKNEREDLKDVWDSMSVNMGGYVNGYSYSHTFANDFLLPFNSYKRYGYWELNEKYNTIGYFWTTSWRNSVNGGSTTPYYALISGLYGVLTQDDGCEDDCGDAMPIRCFKD